MATLKPPLGHFKQQGNGMAILDRGPLIHGGLPERKVRARWTIGVLAILCLALGLITEGLLQLNGPDDSPKDFADHARMTYTSHAPIYIYGNAGFLGDNSSTGVVWGSGTESDPYIIEGWDISNGFGDMGIFIQGTTSSFVIRFCSVHDTGPMGSGIYLSGCINCSLVGNSCWNNMVGIFLSSLMNSTLSDNNCTDNYDGIDMHQSSHNALTNNNCSSNNGAGIYLHSSNENNSLSGNDCSYNHWGINLTSSSDNTLTNNNCSSNNYDGVALWSSSNNTLSDNNCSNDYTGIRLMDSSGVILSNNTCISNHGSAIEVGNGDNNTLINNCCGTCQYGIWISDSKDNTLTNNNCSSNNRDGIYFGGGGQDTNINNEVTRNLVCNNGGHGVNISRGSNNRIWNNTFVNNNGAGSIYDPSHAQANDAGTNNWWNSSDSYGNYWSDWTEPDVAPPDGIVDMPYNIAGSAGDKDYYPLTSIPPEPIPEFGTMPFVAILMAAMVLTIGTRRRKA